jgi:hypothetical protein
VQALADAPAAPQPVVDFIARLMLLKGVPFAYLVPDEGMLPVESLRVFQLDPNWIAALLDGAFSIGRAGAADLQRDGDLLAQLRPRAAAAARAQRRNDAPHLAARKAAAAETPIGPVSGFLLRSQAVSGWPRLNANGYADRAGDNELSKLRVARLSKDVLIGLFEGTVQMLALHEPPEQLHCGVEPSGGQLVTGLRAVIGQQPGAELGVNAPVATRADGQTLQVDVTAGAILAALQANSQDIEAVTAAEFALEMIKGVVKVDYQVVALSEA